ncbi:MULTISPECIES: hypothetical protein [Photorhabdus]|uniref:Uncharacterized protein n=1 Tax=Photorhabdus khanii TaxID=1004150 RepID=A0A7C9GLP1_9GAMM|nr:MULTISPECIES: hypothetical protein [Photorhabdus]MQL50356.1 hypothetical protein [Photorhabdus khanii]
MLNDRPTTDGALRLRSHIPLPDTYVQRQNYVVETLRLRSGANQLNLAHQSSYHGSPEKQPTVPDSWCFVEIAIGLKVTNLRGLSVGKNRVIHSRYAACRLYLH